MKNVVARGTVYLMVAQLTIMLSGYLIHIGLARMLGVEIYGDLGFILSLVLITKTFFLTGVPRAVTKFISENRTRADAVLKAGAELQLILIGICLSIYLFFSENIAHLFRDPSLAGLIRLSAFIVLPLGIYGIYSKGYLNGIRQFKNQAISETVHSIFKVIFAFLLVYLGFGLFGAIAAYILAPLIACMVVLRFTKIKKSDHKFNKLTLLKFALPLTLFYAVTITTNDLGLLAVKRILQQDILTGYYTAANTLSRITLSVFTALPMTMLPSISASVAKRDYKLTKKYINQALRYTVLILFPVTVLISSYSTQIMNLLYSSEFMKAAPVMSILVFAFTFFSIFMILCSFVAGANKPMLTFIFASLSLAVCLILNIILVPLLALRGAAIATLAAAIFGFLLASVYVLTRFKTLISPVSLARITLATAIIYILSRFLYSSGIMFIGYFILLVLVYLFVLIVIKEITKEDLEIAFSSLSPRKFLKS